jgi:hypothetical protein
MKTPKKAKATEVNLEDDQEDEPTVKKLTRKKYKKYTQR